MVVLWTLLVILAAPTYIFGRMIFTLINEKNETDEAKLLALKTLVFAFMVFSFSAIGMALVADRLIQFYQ